MTREEKLEAIYKEMANKELTFGCKLKSGPAKIIICNEAFISEDEVISYEGSVITEIIGHPVMIGDVIDYIETKKFDINKPILGLGFEEEKMSNESKLYLIQEYYISRLIAHWRGKRKPIEDQSDECIDYVYSLIQKD